jgi:Tol biopolymer transport system component
MKRSGLCSWKWFTLFVPVLVAFDLAIAQDPYYDIYAVNIKTGNVFQVSHLANRGEFNPSWSPNRKYIVHDVLDLTATPLQSLGITNVETGETVMLAGGEGGNNAVWSPDGQWIAFDLYPGFGHGEDPRIFVVPARGGEPLFLTDNGVSPSWSANSKMIAFETPGGGSVYTIDVSGANKKQILPGPDKYLWSPKWSPDGQWLFCGAYGYGPSEYWGNLFKIRVDNNGNAIGEPQFVTWLYGGFTLSNNSKSIVQSAGGEIWSVSPARDQWTQLVSPTGSGFGDWDPAFSTDGQYVAFARYTVPPFPKPDLAPELALPASFSLAQNYPNPFNPTTTIRYTLPADAIVSLAVYNVLGQKVVQLIDEPMSAGYHDVVFDASRLASGVYVYRLHAGNFVETKRMSLVK